MKPIWAAALVLALSGSATAQVAILQIQVIDGEGGVHAPGARGVRPLTVEITDETGRPVAHAAVSFHFPDEGPGGIFANGLRTDVATTDERGRAVLRGWQLNRTPGRFQIRITASKEQATAGVVSFQYITGAAEGISAKTGAAPDKDGGVPIKTGSARAKTGSAPTRNAAAASRGSHGHVKLLLIVGLVAGAAAAGVVVARPGATPASIASNPSLGIGTPTITVGRP